MSAVQACGQVAFPADGIPVQFVRRETEEMRLLWLIRQVLASWTALQTMTT